MDNKHMRKIILAMTLMCAATLSAEAQEKSRTPYYEDEKIVIWDNEKAPHSNGLTGEAYDSKPYRLVNTTKAIMYIYHADKAKATGQSVVICPGGGYAKLSMDQEGYMMAQWLAKSGITGIVLEYRLPNGHKEVPLEDAVEAIRIVRKKAKRWNLDPAKVGIMGDSAGGHLSAWTSNAMPEGEKPAFAILYYPAINRTDPLYFKTFSTTGHLIGMDFPEAEADAMSAHHMVTAATPPTLLLLCDDDTAVPPTSPVAYYEALVRYGVTSSLHIFPEGGHSTRVIFDEACKQLYDWLDWLGLTKK
jgi:acetyl esterase/lipase